MIPMRRPNKSFVTNGLVLVGDAAWQVNPLNAGGIGNTFEAGIMAADTISSLPRPWRHDHLREPAA